MIDLRSLNNVQDFIYYSWYNKGGGFWFNNGLRVRFRNLWGGAHFLLSRVNNSIIYSDLWEREIGD